MPKRGRWCQKCELHNFRLSCLVNLTMDQIWEEVQKLVQSLAHRLQTIWYNSSPGSLKITGLLGVAALLVGYYRTRQNQGRDPRDGQNGTEPTASGQESRNPGEGMIALSAAEILEHILRLAQHLFGCLPCLIPYCTTIVVKFVVWGSLAFECDECRLGTSACLADFIFVAKFFSCE